MITNVLMPKLGLVMKKGKIIKWYKKTGEYVKEGELLFQISTEKVVMDIEAKASGYLRIIYAQPGVIVPVSGIVGLMGDKEEALPDIKLPVYESDEEGAKFGVASDAVQEQVSAEPSSDIKASPVSKRLAKEKGIDLSKVKGTGPGGRITEKDIINYKPVGHEMPEQTQPSTPYARKLAQNYGVTIQQVAEFTGDRKIYAEDVIDAGSAKTGGETASTLTPLTDIRKAVAERMSYSAHTTAPVTLGTEIIAEELIKLKNAMAIKYPSDKITINDILVKLTAGALKKHPFANASFDDQGIRLYNVVNIGIGVAIEGGLIVPAIADADKKSIVRISKESKDLIERAKAGKLTLDEISGATFTITNLGTYGIDMFTPIINPPQSATLGIGRIIRKPWVVENRIEIVPIIILSLTFDHRVIDGAPAAQFLMTIKQYIENPYTVLGVL